MTARRQSARLAPSATEWLDQESNVAKLTAHAGRLLQLQRVLELALPRPLARVCRVANLRLGKLVIHATNGAVAVKLRQVVPGLSEKLRQNGLEVNEIEVKVQPVSTASPQAQAKPQRSVGKEAKQGLTTLAQSLPEDSPVRQALQRLIEKN